MKGDSVRGVSSAASVGVLLPCFLIRLYQRFVSPLFPPVCRFTPSCSAYALEAYRRHGLMTGTVLTVHRLMRCGPWCGGGYDPVPMGVVSRFGTRHLPKTESYLPTGACRFAPKKHSIAKHGQKGFCDAV